MNKVHSYKRNMKLIIAKFASSTRLTIGEFLPLHLTWLVFVAISRVSYIIRHSL